MRGKYRLELSKEGWKPVIREFDIRTSQTVDFGTIRLERIDGKLALTTRPTDATVVIDGSFRGRTPVKIDLVSKTYRIGLTKPGYARKEIIATIKPNETTTVSAELSPEFGGFPENQAIRRLTKSRRTGGRARLSTPPFANAAPRYQKSQNRVTPPIREALGRERARQTIERHPQTGSRRAP